MTARLVILAAALIVAIGTLAPQPAECYGCAAVPCFRNGPPCEGQCTCQWIDDIHGTCG